MPLVRVLVVEDYEPLQRFVCSTLRNAPELQVVGAVADGLEAVQKAEELQPDLILLDIGLPTINGIEAARRIRKLSPKSKIIFVSQESSADVAREAFHLGARGYVVKERAGSELLAAVEAVLQGRRFASKGLSKHGFTQAIPAKSSNPRPKKALPSHLRKKAQIPRHHEVQFYPDDAAFLSGFTHFIETALAAGKGVIVVATGSHRKHLVQRLQANGVDTAAATAQGRLISLDVAETLSSFMVDDLPDPVRFQKFADDLVATAAKAAHQDHPQIVACGECAPTLWAQGNPHAAIQLEHLWDLLARTCHLDTLCGYVLSDIQLEQGYVYQRICAEHSAVLNG